MEATQLETRTRVVRWADPVALAAEGTALTGIEFLEAIARGDLPPPPIAALLGMGVILVEPGHVTFTLKPDEHLYNPLGSVHGGAIATLLDTALGCAIHSTLPRGTGYTTVELHVNYIRPAVRATGTLTADARALHVGRTLATATAEVRDAAGKLYAHATTTCLVMGGAS